MAKKLKIFVLVFAVALSLGLLAACAPNEYTLKYAAGEGGGVTGETEQVVKEGEDGSTVTAVADFGYKFVKWSDGVTTAERTDRQVDGDVTVTAEFEFDNMTVMNHLAEQVAEKMFDFTMAPQDMQEDIFVGSGEFGNQPAETVKEAIYVGLEILSAIADTNELKIDVIYSYEINFGQDCMEGKIQCKYYEGYDYRVYLTLGINSNDIIEQQALVVMDININEDFFVNYIDFFGIVFESSNITAALSKNITSALRINFNDCLLMLGNYECSEEEVMNYVVKFIDDISMFISESSPASQLNCDFETDLWSYWVRGGDRYKLSVENNGIQYAFENSFGGAFFYGNAPTITCVPDEGYRFVMWSDGVTSPTRTDVKPTDGNTLTLYAIVEKIN